jgi:TfoX/Sxy family transcriptional regulator of competence genes
VAYDEGMAERIRAEIGDHPGLVEKRMFGGLSFLVHGNMAVGVIGDELCVRVGTDGHDAAISRPGARLFDFTGRPMQGWIVVSPEVLGEDAELRRWIEAGVGHAETLPPK